MSNGLHNFITINKMKMVIIGKNVLIRMVVLHRIFMLYIAVSAIEPT